MGVDPSRRLTAASARVFARAAVQRQVPGVRTPAVMRGLHCRTRIGRGGRLLLDRCHPLTREPYTTFDPQLSRTQATAAVDG